MLFVSLIRYAQWSKRSLLSGVLFATTLLGTAQELPPVLNFSPEIYQADNQNWKLAQDKDGVIYSANNKGLLSYDGAHWRLHPSPNETIVRSVAVIDSLIYTGAYMDFGYWQRDNKGLLSYTSLVDILNIEPLDDEEFWNITTYRDKIIFQSFKRIYSYQPATSQLSVIPFAGTVYNVFSIEDQLIYQIQDKGLYILKDGKQVVWNSSQEAKTNKFIGLHQIGNTLVAITQNGQFLNISEPEISYWEPDFKKNFETINVYTTLSLADGMLAIGTVAQGIIVISEQGKLMYHIDQPNGLANNTVLSLFEDRDANIWAGLNRGISCLNNAVPFSVFIDREGKIGTTYAALEHQGFNYLGTNQGLFVKSKNDQKYTLIEGTEGQVWTLEVINDVLYCGHNNGTFIIQGNRKQLVANIPGTWSIKTVPNHSDILIQGNYDGLYILGKQQGQWKLRNKLKGFDISSKFFEFASPYKILVSHEYKGVYELEVDSAFAKVNNYTTNKTVSKGEYASLEKFDNQIFYANKEGIFIYDNETEVFEKNAKLSAIYTNSYVSGKLQNDGNGKLWAFTKNHLIAIVEDDLEGTYSYDKMQLSPIIHSSQRGYENIDAIGKDAYILGTADGYLKFYFNDTSQPQYDLAMRKVLAIGANQDVEHQPIMDPVTISNKSNNVSFFFSVPVFNKYQNTTYSYRIANYQDTWSPYTKNANIELKNLDYGGYRLLIKAKIGDRPIGNEIKYSFEVLPPWYLSTTMVMGYVVLIILLFVGLNWFYKRYYRRQRERALLRTKKEMELQKLASEKEMIELRNQNLQKDIEARNRELATATMTMISKNKTLTKIKNALLQGEKSDKLEDTIALIDENMTNEKDWKFFEEAFNHADKDFFKRVKQYHPNLTANDLKLCVYLRLNMSSKEIAPLLNISPRSVEIKRYRLRKKIGLDGEVNLNEYFINL